MVRMMLQDFKGIRIDQPNRLGCTALMKAAIQGRTDCARLLLYAGMSMHEGVVQGRTDCARLLYAGRSLHEGVIQGRTDCARLLYAGGIFMKVSYRAGQTVPDFSTQVGL